MGFFRRKPTPVPAPAPVPVPAPAPTPVGSFPGYVYGVATETFAEVASFNTIAGKPVNVVSIYKSFFWDAAFPTDEVKKINASGATTMITWEPWEPNGQAVQAKYTLARINAGDFDTLINNWAKSIKALGTPLLLRFAHEMNGDWYPWGNTNGNTAEGYLNAYKRVWAMFKAAGVTNVKFVWSPNVDFPMGPYYPGSTYVDYVALDGYNWDTSSPEQVFGNSIDAIKGLWSGQESYAKPIFIGETGCPEYSGKPAWITAFFTLLKDRGLVGFIWFNYNKEQNWKIDSSVAATTAFKKGTSTL